MTRPSAGRERLLLPLFAGQLTSAKLRELAAFAEKNSNGVLQVTADQDLAFPLAAAVDPALAAIDLAKQVDPATNAVAGLVFRVCPGNHECKMGLAPTRDVALALVNAMPEAAKALEWALSGCPNSCVQPQLADMGIIVSKLLTSEEGGKAPLFDIYCRTGVGFGEKVQERLTLAELTGFVRQFKPPATAA